MSSRAKRGICFFANPEKKADSSGKPRPLNDTFGIFPQPVQPRHQDAAEYRALESVWQLLNLCRARLQPCRKVFRIIAALAADLSDIELSHRLFSLWRPIEFGQRSFIRWPHGRSRIEIMGKHFRDRHSNFLRPFEALPLPSLHDLQSEWRYNLAAPGYHRNVRKVLTEFNAQRFQPVQGCSLRIFHA